MHICAKTRDVLLTKDTKSLARKDIQDPVHFAHSFMWSTRYIAKLCSPAKWTDLLVV